MKKKQRTDFNCKLYCVTQRPTEFHPAATRSVGVNKSRGKHHDVTNCQKGGVNIKMACATPSHSYGKHCRFTVNTADSQTIERERRLFTSHQGFSS